MNRKLLFKGSILIFMFLWVGLHKAKAQPLVFNWAKATDGPGMGEGAEGKSIARDHAGNLYVTGSFSGTVDFDPGVGIYNLISTGIVDMFVAKYDVSGNLVWAKRIGGNFQVEGFKIAVGVSGDVYTSGYYFDTVDFDPGPGVYKKVSATNSVIGANFNIYICKLSNDGDFVWVKTMGITSSSQVNDLVLDKSDNIYITGFFNSGWDDNFDPINEMDFDPGPAVHNLTKIRQDMLDVYIAKYDSAGNYVWAKNIGSTDGLNLGANTISLDTSGNIFITGGFDHTVDFDPGAAVHNLTGVGESDMYVLKLNNNGDYIWAKNVGATGRCDSYSAATDISGNIYITGRFTDVIDFDPGTSVYNLMSLGTSSVFVEKLSANGDFIWAKHMLGSFNNGGVGRSIAVDDSRNVYLTGEFSDIMDFDPGSGTYNLQAVALTGRSNSFIAKLNTTGNFVWAGLLGGTFSSGNSLQIDRSGNVYTTGMFSDQGDFDPNSGTYTLTTNGMGMYVHKLICGDTSAYIINATACGQYTLNGETYKQSGTYVQRIPNIAGCDSVISITLTIDPLDMSVARNIATLISNQAGATYQWIDCGSGNTIIPGATDQNYTPSQNGSYAVIVTTANNCSDTSDCISVTNTSVAQNSSFRTVNVYPNPAVGEILITTSATVNNASLKLINVIGQVVLKANNLTGKSFKFNMADISNGIYILEIAEGNNKSILKVVKE